MSDYNKLNFPSFEIALEFWESEVLRKWKPEDDWEWWWVVMHDDIPLLLSKEDLEIIFYDFQNGWENKFYAIPCPSLGEMMERLTEKYDVEYSRRGGKSYIYIENERDGGKTFKAGTAPNAAGKALMEVEILK